MPPRVKRGREPEGENTKREIQCLLCDGFFLLKSIWTHFMRTHLPVLASGSTSCLDCSGRHQGDQDPTSRITGIDAWNEHLQSSHCDLFWYFTASRSSFAVAEPPPGTQTNIERKGRKKRKIERTEVGAITPGEISQQFSIDLSITDPIIPDQNDMALRYVSTPESLDEPHTPAPWDGTDINLIDPLLLDEEDRERIKAK